jgi:PAS domain S-box-containing protein
MKDGSKTKRQLIDELAELQQRLSQLTHELEAAHGRIDELEARDSGDAVRQQQESEQRFRTLFEESPIAYQSLDWDGRLLEVNKAWLDLLGYTKEEVIGRSFGEFLAPHLADRFVERFSRFRAEGEAHDVRWEVVRRNGTHLIVSLDGTAGLDLQGNFRTHCVMRDITQIIHAEEERAQTAAGLKESEERYRSLFENASLGIGYYTPDGKVIAFNNAAAAQLNGQPEDYAGRSLSDILGEEAGAVYSERIKIALGSPGPLTFEDHVALPAGDRWFVSTFNRIADAAGKIVGIQVISNDITERKRSEEALQNSEARYRGLVEGSPDIVWSFSDARGTVYASPRVEAILGYSPDHLYKNPWLWNKSIHPGDQDRIAQAIAEFAAGKDLDVEYRIGDASGNWRWFRDRSIGRRMEGEETIIEGISTDITDRVHAEEALREEHANLLAILESTEDLIAVRDRAGRLVFCNTAFAQIARKLFGVEAKCGLKTTDYLPPERQAHWKHVMERVLTGEDYHEESEWDYGNREARSHEIALKPIMKGSDIIGTVEFNRDVTERKQAQRRISRQRSDLERLSARLIHAQEEERKRISHELHDEIGQALTGISINLAEIEKGLSPALAQTSSERLVETRSLADRLLEQVREMALDLRPAMLDDLGLVPTLRWYVKRFAKRANIDVDLDVSGFDERPAAEVETALYRVVQEALTNIVRHANASRISVRLGCEDAELSATIEDDGVGFDVQNVPGPEALEAGVGLTGIQERIASLEGKVNITSRPGQGTRVKVEIPLYRQGGSRGQD